MNDSKWLFYSKKNFTTRFKNLRGNSMKLTNLNKIFLEEHTLKLNKFYVKYSKNNKETSGSDIQHVSSFLYLA